MARSDISHQLIHFTRGESLEDAFSNLCRIVEDRTLRGSGTKIREGHVCVCFTEAPLALLPGGLVNPEAYSHYSPFGMVFDAVLPCSTTSAGHQNRETSLQRTISAPHVPVAEALNVSV